MITKLLKSKLLNKPTLSASLLLSLCILFSTSIVNAASSSKESSSVVMHFGTTFVMFALLLLVGKLGSMIEKYGQPAVVGELLAGIILSAFAYFGWNFVNNLRQDEIIAFVAQFGALLLLFSIGLESNITEMKKVGLRALLVALIGVIFPFVLGVFVISPWLFPDSILTTKLFIGAALVATSVGVTASVFRSLKIEKTRAAKTVIGAAVIDDILGLLVLAIVAAMASGEQLSGIAIAKLVITSFGFLIISVILGSVLAKPISKLFTRIHSGISAKVTLAISLALLFGFLAEIAGLEPIIGAFAAGLILDSVHFDSFADPEVIKDLKEIKFTDNKDAELVNSVIKKHRHAHIEDLVNNIGFIFVPVFFVFAGLQIDFASLLKPQLYLTAFIISVLAIFGKLVAGFAAQGTLREKLLVGASMVPRGEVGLVFATTGATLGVLDTEQFSTIVIVIIFTTFVAPYAIKKLAQDKPSDKLPNSRYKNLFSEILKRKHYTASNEASSTE